MSRERDDREIGALWSRTSRTGVEFMSGTINGVEVVCFRARPTESGRGPTWRVLKSEPRTERPAPAIDDFPPADDDIGF